MKTLKQSYAELLNLTQLFLIREHSLQKFKVVDPTTLAFFQKKMKGSYQPFPKKTVSHASFPSLPTTSMRATTMPPSPDPQPPQTIPEPPPLEPLPPATPPEPVIPPSQPPAIQDKSTQTKLFSLEPLKASPPVRDPREFWKLCPTLFPDWALCETIPNDAIAQKNKNTWLRNQEISPVIILSFHDHEQYIAFLKNLAQAISLRLAPAQVLFAPKWEKENHWENILNAPQLRLIIASDYGLYLQPKLMHFYREIPQQSKHFLHQTPLLLLSDLSLYLKEPQLKPLLWRAICNEFASSPSLHSRPG